MYLKYLILLIFITSVFSQTTEWKIVWNDVNPDSINIKSYEVYRSNNPGASIILETVNHPTTEYTDSNLIKGVLYYYRLKAENQSNLKSDFSMEVYAAIPELLVSSETIYQGEWFSSITKSDCINYPNDDELIWSVICGNNITASFTETSIVLAYPTNWSGTETLTFKVANEIGFNEVQSISFTVKPTIIVPPSNIKFEFID